MASIGNSSGTRQKVIVNRAISRLEVQRRIDDSELIQEIEKEVRQFVADLRTPDLCAVTDILGPTYLRSSQWSLPWTPKRATCRTCQCCEILFACTFCAKFTCLLCSAESLWDGDHLILLRAYREKPTIEHIERVQRAKWNDGISVGCSVCCSRRELLAPDHPPKKSWFQRALFSRADQAKWESIMKIRDRLRHRNCPLSQTRYNRI